MYSEETLHSLKQEVSKFALSTNKDKRLQSIDSKKTYVYGASKSNV